MASAGQNNPIPQELRERAANSIYKIELYYKGEGKWQMKLVSAMGETAIISDNIGYDQMLSLITSEVEARC